MKWDIIQQGLSLWRVADKIVDTINAMFE